MAKMTLAEIKALAAAAKETQTNMTEVKKGGEGARLLPEGYSLARIVGVIQFGKQPQKPFKGKPKQPCPELTLQFALYDQGYCNDDGTPYVVDMYPFTEQTWDKSKALKMFKLLNWQNLHTTWIDLIGEPIMVKIEHYKGGKDKKETKSSIKWDGFLPPTNPRSGKLEAFPEGHEELDEELLTVFLWDYPTIENWDSLRDWYKDRCLGAVDFPGSELEGLLIENGRPITPSKKSEGTEDDAPDAPEEQEDDPKSVENTLPDSGMVMPPEE